VITREYLERLAAGDDRSVLAIRTQALLDRLDVSAARVLPIVSEVAVGTVRVSSSWAMSCDYPAEAESPTCFGFDDARSGGHTRDYQVNLS
jgi:hypothetical protein